MKRYITMAISILFLAGCAANNPQPKPQPKPDKKMQEIEAFVKGEKINSPVKKISKFVDKPVNVKEVNKILLKTNPLYASKYKKEALKEKINLAPNAPLYRPPLFAEMIVFPYVSDDGIYHDTQKVWIKIKNGEFVLSQNPKNYKPRVFGINGGY